MKVTQYFPAFCEGFVPERYEVTTKEELEAIPFVKKWAEDPAFVCFGEDDEGWLLAVMQKQHWVVARLIPSPGFYPYWKTNAFGYGRSTT